jgi:hypothetical protein
MDIPMMTDGARLPTQALLVSMALAGAVSAADGGIKAPAAAPDVPSRRGQGRSPRSFALRNGSRAAFGRE